MYRLLVLAGSGWLILLLSAIAAAPVAAPPAAPVKRSAFFALSSDCMACHNGLATPAGTDVSIGVAWRATMMANSSRDPYWQASVRRETIDHPKAAAEIEDECAVCHMPMSHTVAHASGRAAKVFAHLPAFAEASAGRPPRYPNDPESRLAQDGTSCTLCHQITSKNLGTPASFTGGFVIDTSSPVEQRPLYGPFPPDRGLRSVMHSATGFQQSQGMHIRQSEMCATCHTLYTTARGPGGEAIGRFPEQVPFQEWQHSRYSPSQSCQSCHMPEIAPPAPIASVLGEPRTGARQHTFLGGNFFVLRMLNRFRADLGVDAPSTEMDTSERATLAHLGEATARLSIGRAALEGGRLFVDVSVENLSGHKLPTAYPSRRAWIRLTVRDSGGRIVFASGALGPDGAIAGNDNDVDASAFEPHYRQITQAGQVQIYEAILADASGAVTTGLLTALRYVKDNRLLPHGFDKATAGPDIAVHGGAMQDADFTAGTDRVQYAIDVAGAQGALTVEAALLFQPIGFRWAENLRPYKAAEPARFIRYYDAMTGGTAAPLAKASVTVTR
jgi:hypothetical protein